MKTKFKSFIFLNRFQVGVPESYNDIRVRESINNGVSEYEIIFDDCVFAKCWNLRLARVIYDYVKTNKLNVKE